MSIVPVIGRELRSQARQPLTFLLRLAGAAAICIALGLAFSTVRGDAINQGHLAAQALQQQTFQHFGVALFGKMNLTIFIAIWLLTPLAAADSISRERREGTLPLLQLTQLRPWEVVVGKSFVHMLRSSSVFLTMLPWLLIPFLFGGLSLGDLRLALILDVSALLLAHSAGLLASTFSRDWMKSVIWAEVIAFIMLLGMLGRYEGVLEEALTNGAAPVAPRFGGWTPPPPTIWTISQPYRGTGGFIEKQSLLLGLITNGEVNYQEQWGAFGPASPEFKSSWQGLWAALTPVGQSFWQHGALSMLAGAALVFLTAVVLGAERIRRSWRENPTTEASERLRKKYFTPKYAVRTLRKRLSRSLSRNPIGWLHHYSPSARLTKWSWCMFLIIIEVILATDYEDLYAAQIGLGLLLTLGLVFSSSGSFRDELETGAFELLLVTPVREGQILLGRVGGIWKQFFPAFLIYGAGALFLASGWSDHRTEEAAKGSILQFGLLFFTAPFIGLYFSLLRWNFLAAWVCASFVSLLFPFILWSRAGIPGHFTQGELIVWQLCLAAVFAWRIRHRLQNRLALAQAAQQTAAA